MPKRKRRSKLNFWKNIRFKYKLFFLNENTLEEVFSFRISKLSAFLYLGIFAGLLIFLTSVVIINTPIRNYLPGYLDVEVRKVMVENVLRTDSLEQAVSGQTLYLRNVMGILRGDIKVDSAKVGGKVHHDTALNLDKSKLTEEFVTKYEEEEKYNLQSPSPAASIPDNIVFYKPVRGTLSSPFDWKQKHYGVDIAADLKESVISTMKGTVIFTGFDANVGYVIHIQHNNGFVSIYKHNESLLKKIGDEVAAGEAIALAGNTGILSSGPHLHFELWYKGIPVDPQKYIVF